MRWVPLTRPGGRATAGRTCDRGENLRPPGDGTEGGALGAPPARTGGRCAAVPATRKTEHVTVLSLKLPPRAFGRISPLASAVHADTQPKASVPKRTTSSFCHGRVFPWRLTGLHDDGRAVPRGCSPGFRGRASRRGPSQRSSVCSLSGRRGLRLLWPLPFPSGDTARPASHRRPHSHMRTRSYDFLRVRTCTILCK